MKAIEPFELPDVAYPVPNQMEHKLSKVLLRTYRIEVEWLAEGKRERINGVELEMPKEGQGSEITIEDLCQVCLAMAYLHTERIEATTKQAYRVRQFWRDDKDKDHRAFFQFHVPAPGEQNTREMTDQEQQYGYGGIETPESRYELMQRYQERHQRQSADAQTMMMRQMDATLSTILRANSQVLEEQRKMNEENRIALRESRKQTSDAQDRLFKMALAMGAHNDQMDRVNQQAMQMFTVGWQWFWWSQQQQTQNMERRHREELERLSKEEKSKDRWEMFGSLAPAGMAMIGAFLTKLGNPDMGETFQDMAADAAQAQAAGQQPGEPDAEGPPSGWREPAYDTTAQPSAAPQQPQQPPQPQQPQPQPQPQQPAAPKIDPDTLVLHARAQRFGSLFTEDAWTKLRAVCSPEQVDAINDLCIVDDDRYVWPVMMKLDQVLERPQKDVLFTVITHEQQALIRSITKELERQAREKLGSQADPATPPSPSPPGFAPPGSSDAPGPPVAPSPPTHPPGPPTPPGFGPPSSPGTPPGAPPGGTGDAPGAGAAAELRKAVEEIPGLRKIVVDELLKRFPSLPAVHSAGAGGLQEIPGVGLATARRIIDSLPPA